MNALEHPVRRTVLAVLAERGSVRRAQLAVRLAADDRVPVDDERRIEILLHHNHLPKLSDAQYVEYDQRSGDVALWTEPESVRTLLKK